MRRVLVTGGAGLLGSALLRAAPSDVEPHATRRRTPVSAEGVEAHSVDLADAEATRDLWRRVRPDVVIHTAYSYDEGERDVWEATRSVVAACRETGAALVHLSSDVVLGGEHAPYDEAAEPAPVHDYGRWKARAEAHVRAETPGAAVIRTSLIVGVDPLDRGSAWIVGALGRGEPVRLFVDELRCPTAADDLAAQLWEVAALPAEERGGVWNLAGPEAVSRHTLGVLVALRHGLDPAAIVPARSADHPAPRPRDLRLTTARADRTLRARARPIGEALLGEG